MNFISIEQKIKVWISDEMYIQIFLTTFLFVEALYIIYKHIWDLYTFAKEDLKTIELETKKYYFSHNSLYRNKCHFILNRQLNTTRF